MNINKDNSDGSGASSNFTDRFQFQKSDIIGQGNVGTVYKALDMRTGRLIAVKSIKISPNTDVIKRGMDLLSIKNEIRNLRQLSHPNIVKYLHSQVCCDNQIDLILEMVSGGSLRQFLDQFGRFDEHLVRIYTH
jgi:serine/threonine protein kinase